MELITTTDLSLTTQQRIVYIEQQIKELKELQENYKKQLCELMEQNGVDKITNDNFTITLVPKGEVVKFDLDTLKEKYEDIYIECQKKSTRNAYVKISLK